MVKNKGSRNYLQGKYEVVNVEKYKADPAKCSYRSSYELHTWEWADRTPTVLEWAVETIVVPYFDPVKNKNRRYIVDLWLKFKDRNGDIHTEIVEIKPMNQVIQPKKGGKKESTFLTENLTYVTNMAKWSAAKEYARLRGWNFRIITEESIFK